MSPDDLANAVLCEAAARWDEARARPKPPRWHSLDAAEYELARDFGPRYSPTWFGDLTATEAGRQRVLRTVYRLAGAGLLEVFKSAAGRLERVRLTGEGRAAVAGLRTASAPRRKK
jgi:hypothetical protein